MCFVLSPDTIYDLSGFSVKIILKEIIILTFFSFLLRKTIDAYAKKMQADGIDDLGPVYTVMKKLLDQYDASRWSLVYDWLYNLFYWNSFQEVFVIIVCLGMRNKTGLVCSYCVTSWLYK